MQESIVVKANEKNRNQSLLEILVELGLESSFCNGSGACGRCKVRFVSNAPIPTVLERHKLSLEQLRNGVRLACQIKMKQDCNIEVCFVKQSKYNILTKQVSFGEEDKTKIYEQTQQRFMEDYFVAVDLGTTTVVMQAVTIKQGQRLDCISFFNPQRSFGVDVLARMQKSIDGKRDILQKIILEKLEEGIEKFNEIYCKKPVKIVISGNTTMIHLLMGYSLKTMAKYPFTPVNIKQINTVIAGIISEIIPGISAFVGGDLVSGWYSIGLHNEPNLHFLIDLGTNGEMILGNKEQLFVTSTAAGPAFEGGANAEILGTDMVAIISDLLTEHIIDETGLMIEPFFTTGFSLNELLITQEDVRNMQKAKAAIHVGMEILLEKCEVDWSQVETCFLAGGFGYGLDVEKAKHIGLFPKEIENKVTSIGNASLAGAIAFGLQQPDLEYLAVIATEINLAKEPSFEHRFIEELNF